MLYFSAYKTFQDLRHNIILKTKFWEKERGLLTKRFQSVYITERNWKHQNKKNTINHFIYWWTKMSFVSFISMLFFIINDTSFEFICVWQSIFFRYHQEWKNRMKNEETIFNCIQNFKLWRKQWGTTSQCFYLQVWNCVYVIDKCVPLWIEKHLEYVIIKNISTFSKLTFWNKNKVHITLYEIKGQLEAVFILWTVPPHAHTLLIVKKNYSVYFTSKRVNWSGAMNPLHFSCFHQVFII